MGKTLSFEESGEAVYAAMVKVQYDVYNVHVHVGTCTCTMFMCIYFRLSLSSPVYQVSCFVLYTWIRTQPAELPW